MFHLLKKRHTDRREVHVDMRGVFPTLNNQIVKIWNYNCDTIKTLDNISLPESVWGISATHKLSCSQLKIHDQVKPIIENLLKGLAKENFEQRQLNFIEHAVKELITIKLAYLRDVTLLRTSEGYLVKQLSKFDDFLRH